MKKKMHLHITTILTEAEMARLMYRGFGVFPLSVIEDSGVDSHFMTVDFQNSGNRETYYYCNN